jgi:hypothetical protein
MNKYEWVLTGNSTYGLVDQITGAILTEITAEGFDVWEVKATGQKFVGKNRAQRFVEQYLQVDPYA